MRLLAASWVVPVAGPPLRDGCVAIEGERILWLGRRGDPGAPQAPLSDLGSSVLLPGLVNAHCHLELSHLDGRVESSGGFVHWVERLVHLRDEAGAHAVRTATAAAIRTLEETGTVAVGDVSNRLQHLDLLAASGLAPVVFFELLGWDPARARGILDGAQERLDDVARRTASTVAVRLAAHAPYSVSPALFRGLVRAGGPSALHLAESPAESRFLADGSGEWPAFLKARGLDDVGFEPPGLSPVRYVESLGVLHPGLVAAHCVQVDAADRALLAGRGVHVAVCPRSNGSLGVGLPPVPELLEAGVRLCLGTDSLASVESLDLMADAAALRAAFPKLDPAVILRMATRGGAEALGFDDLGTIAPGQRAALAFAAMPSRENDPQEFLLSGDARVRPVRP